MFKKIFAILTFIFIASIAIPAFAQTSTDTNTKINCIGTAVNKREQSINTAISAFATSTNTIYSTRASALQSAYQQTTASSIKSATKTAWTNFNKAIKSAQKTWQSANSTAWKNYKSAALACKATIGISDGANETYEFLHVNQIAPQESNSLPQPPFVQFINGIKK